MRKKKQQVNFSKSHKDYVKKLKRTHFTIIFFRIFVLVAFLGLWELLTYCKVMDPFFVSSPSRIVLQIAELATNGTLLNHSLITLGETLIGFAIATILGYAIAVLLWWNEKVRKVFEPYIVVLNSLPKIALGPVIILWVGAGTQAIVLMCVLICIVITTMSMLSAFLSVEEGKILLLKSMHANKFQIFFQTCYAKFNARIYFSSKNQRWHELGRKHYGRISNQQGRSWIFDCLWRSNF